MHEVELSQISLFCHKGQYDVEIVEAPKRVVVIKSPETIEEGTNLDPHWAFWAFWEIIRDPGGCANLPTTLEEIRMSGTGFKHLAGLVNLMCRYTFEEPDVMCQLRYPEAHLHPSVQAALADLLIAMRYPMRAIVFHLTQGRRPMLRLPAELIHTDEEGEQ